MVKLNRNALDIQADLYKFNKNTLIKPIRALNETSICTALVG